MAKCTYHGFQKSIEGAPDPIGIVMGANLRKRPQEPTEAAPRDDETPEGSGDK
jgi:hypothetical protein